MERLKLLSYDSDYSSQHSFAESSFSYSLGQLSGSAEYQVRLVLLKTSNLFEIRRTPPLEGVCVGPCLSFNRRSGKTSVEGADVAYVFVKIYCEYSSCSQTHRVHIHAHRLLKYEIPSKWFSVFHKQSGEFSNTVNVRRFFNQ